MSFAQIYECPKCGETWKVSPVKSIDTENDRVEMFLVCDVCGSDVWKEKKTEDGKLCMHALSESEIEAEMFSEGEEDDFNDDDF